MISRVGRASRFLSLLPLDASVHQMPFYLKMYLNLLIGRIHVTRDIGTLFWVGTTGRLSFPNVWCR